MSSRNNPARVAIVMGSKSDWATMQFAAEIFEILNVPHHVEVVSAHRTPDKLFSFAESFNTLREDFAGQVFLLRHFSGVAAPVIAATMPIQNGVNRANNSRQASSFRGPKV